MNIVGEIRYYVGDDNYATLKFSESKSSFSLDIVVVPAAHRGKGIGATLITHVLRLAESMGKDVYVSARPLGPFSQDRLERLIGYYQRFGFELYDRGLTVAYMCKKITRGESTALAQ